MKNPPRVVIIAGPNGAGKTSFAREYLPNQARCPRFLNVNLLAQGLSPFDPAAAAEKARWLMRSEIWAQVQRHNNFSIETTFSNLTYARGIRSWQKLGYRVEIIFLGLAAAELSVARVHARVAQGGHHVPEEEIRHRFAIGLHNFQTHYQSMADAWVWIDNSAAQPVVVKAHGIHPVIGARTAGRDGITTALRRAASNARQLARRTNTPMHYWRNGRLMSVDNPMSADHCRVA